jgi:hypothetical protein
MLSNLEGASSVVDVEALEMKIKAWPGLTTAERRLMLCGLHLDKRSNEHKYPNCCCPASSLYASIAWEILDGLPPDALPTRDRFMLGAKITEALRQIHEEAEPVITLAPFREEERP